MGLTPKLFTPLKVGRILLKHRVVMAPMTRVRSPGGVPTDVVREYYEQRASDGGLLISEGVHTSMMAGNYTYVPGIYTPEHVRAWKTITNAVHKKGGYIFAQLWHVGRASHPINLGDRLPLAPSSIRDVNGKTGFTPKGLLDTVLPKAMTIEDIQDTISDYVHAAKCAIAAGFDGVEVHGANGYLIDQFICSNINHRTDAYGGSRENRARFACEVVDAVIAGLGDSKLVGVRFSPFGSFGGTDTEDPVLDYGYVIQEMDKRDLAYVHLIEFGSSFFGMPESKIKLLKERAESRGLRYEDEAGLKPFRSLLKNTVLLGNGPYLGSDGIDVEEERLSEKDGKRPLMDAAVYGRYFISNPDLPERLRLGRELNPYDRSTFYTQGTEGYVDYPTWEEKQRSKI